MVSSLMFHACAKGNKKKDISEQGASRENVTASGNDTAYFAAGCFWCVEAQLKELLGVVTVISGYTGGHVKNPTYEAVCAGTTGHAETVQVIYDPRTISYDELLEAFFLAHDPTQLNRQGNDVGTQYRSAIFFRNAKQKEKALEYIKRLNEEKVYPSPIVTEVSPLGVFYRAENYHQNYYALNPDAAYCQYVIKPKMEKFKKVFQEKLK